MQQGRKQGALHCPGGELIQDGLELVIWKAQLSRRGKPGYLGQLHHVLRWHRRAEEVEVLEQRVVVEVLRPPDEPKLDVDRRLRAPRGREVGMLTGESDALP